MVDWTKETKLQGENTRAANGRVLAQLVEALQAQIEWRGEESLDEDVHAVLALYKPISCSNCFGSGHWADDCPRRVVQA